MHIYKTKTDHNSLLLKVFAKDRPEHLKSDFCTVLMQEVILCQFSHDANEWIVTRDTHTFLFWEKYGYVALAGLKHTL